MLIDSWENDDTPYTRIAEVQWGEASYNFDLTRVYHHRETGELFYAKDRGCSCPSPFEDTTEADLTPITRMHDWYEHVTRRTADLYDGHTATADQVVYASGVISEWLNRG